MKKSISLILALFLTTSCGQLPKKKITNSPKAYGQDVEDEFSAIETGTNSQKDVLQYYRKLRQQNWNNYKKGAGKSFNWKRRRKMVPHKRKASVKKKLKPTPKRTPKPLAANIVKDMKIEISQYMGYYCMQNRKSSRFSNPADCSAYTESILRECENKHPIISNRGLVRCVQNRLK